MYSSIRKILIVLLFINCFASICANNDRELIIYIDYKNEIYEKWIESLQNPMQPTYSFGAISRSLIQGIETANSPILVTATLWKNVLARAIMFRDFITLSIEQLKEKYKDLPQEVIDSFGSIENLQQICLRARVNNIDPRIESHLVSYLALSKFSQNWQMHKTLSAYYYLLIPKGYTEKLAKEYPTPPETPEIKKDDLILGLKTAGIIENPFPADIKEFNAPSSSMAYVFSLIPFLNSGKLFVTLDQIRNMAGVSSIERQNIQNRYAHNWYLYLEGHGRASEAEMAVIGGMPKHIFSQFLSFLNNHIQTRLLAYFTCYSGGPHLIIPYEKQPTIQETFKFMIITGSFSYIPTYVKPFKLSQKEKGKPWQVISTMNFSQFFEKIKQYNKFFLSIVSGLQPAEAKKIAGQSAKATQRLLIEGLSNVQFILAVGRDIPAIRFPGTEWFSVSDVDKRVLIITRVMADVKQAEKKPIIVDKDKEAIVFNTNPLYGTRTEEKRSFSEILTPIIIKSENLKEILSAAPFNATYYLQKMQIDTSLRNLAYILFWQEMNAYGRTLYINELVCNSDPSLDILIFDPFALEPEKREEIVTLKNVIIFINDEHPLSKTRPEISGRWNGIMFDYKDKHYIGASDTLYIEDIMTWRELKLRLGETMPQYPKKIEGERGKALELFARLQEPKSYVQPPRVEERMRPEMQEEKYERQHQKRQRQLEQEKPEQAPEERHEQPKSRKKLKV